jgi:amino acid transporter
MKNSKDKPSKMSLVALVLMIFTSVYGFNNIPRAFYLMGYSAIPWYILGAIGFFIPYAFMMAEFGTAFRNEKGGIYSWMEKSIGGKFAFIGTFMWYSSYIVWMVSISSSIWVPLSNLIFGSDNTSSWSVLGLNAPKTLALLGILFIILMTFLSTRGLNGISKFASLGGIFVASANVILIIGALIVLVGNGFNFAQPITIEEFIKSPNPAYGSIFGILGFLVFSIFAYGGIETVGGLVDETDNPQVNFPKGIKIAAFVIGIGYSLGILMVGFFINWDAVLTSDDVGMANVTYIVIKNLGLELGKIFNL